MRTQLWLLVALAASHAVAVPVDTRHGGKKPPGPDPDPPLSDPEDQAKVEAEQAKQDAKDLSYGEYYDKHEAKWYLVKGQQGSDAITVAFENSYPWYSNQFFDKNKITHDNTGLRMRYYDYPGDLADWKVRALTEKDALEGGHVRALSNWRAFPKSKEMTAVLKDKGILEARKKIGRCPAMSEKAKAWEKWAGFSQGETLLTIEPKTKKKMHDDASWYNAEHVYEKQILSKFFQKVFDKVADAKWFKKVAENPLDGLEDTKALDKLVYYVFDICPWDSSDKQYVSLLNKQAGSSAGAAAQVPSQYIPSHWKARGKDTLAQALASVLGSNYRLDHMSLLEDDLNQLKGRMFGGKRLHAKDKIKHYDEPKCIKNPELFKEQYAQTPAKPGPAGEQVYKDRINTLRQPIFVWQYFKAEWERFASTSREVHQLLTKFDQAYKTIRSRAQSDPNFYADKEAKEGVKLVPEWKKGPGDSFEMATEYENFLGDYLKGVVDAVHKEMLEHHAWMSDEFKMDTVSGLSSSNPSLTVEKLLADWKTEINKYDDTNFYTGWIEKRLNDCFKKANAGRGGKYGSCVQPDVDGIDDITGGLQDITIGKKGS